MNLQRSKTSKSKKAGPKTTVVSKAVASGKLVSITRDPKKAEAFLKQAGIITRAGKLAPKYAA